MDYFDSLLSDWEDGQSLERKQNKSGFYKLMKERGFDFDDVDEYSRLPKSLEPVIENKTVPVLYEAPLMLHQEGLDEVAVKILGLPDRPIDLSEWSEMIDRIHSSDRKVTIAMVGKYMELHDAYLSVMEALKHASWQEGATVNIKWVDSETVTKDSEEEIFSDVDGILVPGGFGYRGVEGKIEAVRWARTNNIPFLGICLGMQVAVIEFARNVIGLKEANSSEFLPGGKESVIDIMPDQLVVTQCDKKIRVIVR